MPKRKIVSKGKSISKTKHRFPKRISKGQITSKETKNVGFLDKEGNLLDSAPVESIAGIGIAKGKYLRSQGISTVGKFRKRLPETKIEKKKIELKPKVISKKINGRAKLLNEAKLHQQQTKKEVKLIRKSFRDSQDYAKNITREDVNKEIKDRLKNQKDFLNTRSEFARGADLTKVNWSKKRLPEIEKSIKAGKGYPFLSNDKKLSKNQFSEEMSLVTYYSPRMVKYQMVSARLQRHKIDELPSDIGKIKGELRSWDNHYESYHLLPYNIWNTLDGWNQLSKAQMNGAATRRYEKIIYPKLKDHVKKNYQYVETKGSEAIQDKTESMLRVDQEITHFIERDLTDEEADELADEWDKVLTIHGKVPEWKGSILNVKTGKWNKDLSANWEERSQRMITVRRTIESSRQYHIKRAKLNKAFTKMPKELQELDKKERSNIVIDDSDKEIKQWAKAPDLIDIKYYDTPKGDEIPVSVLQYVDEYHVRHSGSRAGDKFYVNDLKKAIKRLGGDPNKVSTYKSGSMTNIYYGDTEIGHIYSQSGVSGKARQFRRSDDIREGLAIAIARGDIPIKKRTQEDFQESIKRLKKNE